MSFLKTDHSLCHKGGVLSRQQFLSSLYGYYCKNVQILQRVNILIKRLRRERKMSNDVSNAPRTPQKEEIEVALDKNIL